jgi:hypothetical protein
MIGQAILHRRIVEKLGGGMGTIGKAEDVQPGRIMVSHAT